MLKLLAFDYGASSGRAVLGSFDGNRMELAEMHRVFKRSRISWGFFLLGFSKAAS